MSTITNETRQEAFETCNASADREVVLRIISASPVPLGATDVARIMRRKETSVRPRISELKASRLILAVGRHKMENGRSEATFQAVQAIYEKNGQALLFRGSSV